MISAVQRIQRIARRAAVALLPLLGNIAAAGADELLPDCTVEVLARTERGAAQYCAPSAVDPADALAKLEESGARKIGTVYVVAEPATYWESWPIGRRWYLLATIVSAAESLRGEHVGVLLVEAEQDDSRLDRWIIDGNTPSGLIIGEAIFRPDIPETLINPIYPVLSLHSLYSLIVYR